MKIIVSGGGTGGHIYPAVTLIKAISALQPGCEFLYVGTKVGLEADIIPKEGIRFETVDIQGFRRKLSAENIKTIMKSAASLWHSRKIISAFSPDVAIGTGGYVCGPVLMAASLMGIPTMIQEQNVLPGVTNKILAKFVSKIAVGYAEAIERFPAEKVVYTGNPIRGEVMTADRTEGLSAFGLDAKKKTILISGGSRGARSINRAMIGAHRYFAGSDTVQLLHATGKNEYNDVVARLKKLGIDRRRAGNIIIEPYLYDMPKALALADLAIFRAGAVGLAELTARGIPSILVPYPYAAENHQEYNAAAMQKRGAAVVVKDNDISAEKLIDHISALMDAKEKLNAMAEASRALGKPEAAADIAKIAIGLAAGNRS